MKKIAIVGLGYVGLPLAIEFGWQRRVVGFDISRKRISELVGGQDRTLECTKEQIQRAVHLTFTDSIDDISDAEIFIVTVPTPVDRANRPDLNPLRRASRTVGRVLKRGDIVIYESTVYPGATEEECVPVLEEESGLRFNVDFFCGYSPERINPGDKENTLTKIKKITSGSTIETASEVDLLYREIIVAGTYKAPSIKVAEAAKVIENSQRDLNIAFVNELSIIFSRMGIDTLDVLEAAGSKWNFLPFRPGMVGGHCIGVDPYYLTHKAEELGYHPQVILAGRRINDDMARVAGRRVIKSMLQQRVDVCRSRVAVFGVTFKDSCPDIRNSKVIDLIDELQQWGVEVTVFDPWADADEVVNEYGIHLADLRSDWTADSIVVAVGHECFRSLQPSELRHHCRVDSPVFADLKGVFDREDLRRAGFSVLRL
jgi:UDP-N-acetyl-D-galactosamine dehydrogenase